MSILGKKQMVLEILVENLENPQPQIVYSRTIADRLDMSIKETCQLLKIMHEKGLVVSDSEGEKSLITQAGVQYVNQ
jgi:predicted transcriptional regulator